MSGFDEVYRPKGGEARLSRRRECNLVAAVGREWCRLLVGHGQAFAARKPTLLKGDIVTRRHRV